MASSSTTFSHTIVPAHFRTLPFQSQALSSVLLSTTTNLKLLSHLPLIMALASQGFRKPAAFMIFLLSLVNTHELQSQSILTHSNETRVIKNATLTLYSNGCYCTTEDPCGVYTSNNFTLAPEVCLSGVWPHVPFQLSDVPQCGGHGWAITPTLITYSEGNCTGRPISQTLPISGPTGGCIQFPMSTGKWVLQHWSLIFHCHYAPFDGESDPFNRTYTNGGSLQAPVKAHEPLALCEHRLPRLNDGLVHLKYHGCDQYEQYLWKSYDLPIDTCQQTHGAKGLKIYRPGTCTNDSRSRIARYLDEKCKDLHDITEIKDEDMSWNACQILDDTTPQIGSIAFYCDGLDSPKSINSAIIAPTNTRDLTLSTPLPKPLPPKPLVPFWQGLVLVEQVVSSARDDRYKIPKFEIVHRDECYWHSITPLKIFQIPRCWNGTKAHVVFYTWPECNGEPFFYNGSDEEVMERLWCFSTSTGYNSLFFWCEGPEVLPHTLPAPA